MRPGGAVTQTPRSQVGPNALLPASLAMEGALLRKLEPVPVTLGPSALIGFSLLAVGLILGTGFGFWMGLLIMHPR